MIIFANITALVEKLIVWHKALPTYREGDMVWIEIKTGIPDIVGKGERGDIIVQGYVINGATKL